MLLPLRLWHFSSPPCAILLWKSLPASFWTEAAAALHPLDPRLRSFERQPLRTASSTLVEERSVHAKVTDFHMS